MLFTPFGEIVLLFDGIEYSYVKEPLQDLFRDVDGCFRLKYEYISDGKIHYLKCVLKTNEVKAYPETGERLECVAFYIGDGKLSIACSASFGYGGEDGYDFDGWLDNDGVTIQITEQTNSNDFVFGVCWICHCTDENDVQTWFGAEPYIKK